MQGEGGSLTIAELSQREGISMPNVAKMMRVMRRAGFVKSTRGKDGGYTLARRAEDLPVAEVLATLGGRLYEPDFCERHSGSTQICAHDTGCSIRSVWQLVQGAVDQALSRMTLKDLLTGHTPSTFVPLAAGNPRAIPLTVLTGAGRS
jgi:Rrf2 family protein